MTMRDQVLLFACLSVAVKLPAQNTVGLLTYAPAQSFPGFNLVFPHGQGTVWLLNACGEVVHRWDDALNRVPGNAVRLQPNGDLLVCYNRRGSATDPIWAGGGGQWVELRSWDNELKWSFALNNASARLHHDAIMLPDGHVLMIAWENKTPEEAIQAGRDPALITEDALWPDYILEYAPELDSVVWRWHAWDHLVQEHDPTKDNFGLVRDHPGRIDLNHIYISGQADWMHVNAIDYHPGLDLIMLSVPHFDEIWFIDHSTTMAESAGSSGGYWRKGGDIIYRWGNPRAYGRGDSTDQQVFFGHDCHWIDDFVGPEHPHYGQVAFFNNRVGVERSRADIFAPVADTLTRTFGMIGNVWGPARPADTLQHPESPFLMWSSGLSSYQLLPNGNTLILVGRSGYAFELTPDNAIVWEYIVPIRNGAFIAQGETAQNNTTFRMTRYPTDYPAFEGKDLSGIGYMELEPDTTSCDRLVAVDAVGGFDRGVHLYPNPAYDAITVECPAARGERFVITDMDGQISGQGRLMDGATVIPVDRLLPGVYLLRIEGCAPAPFAVVR
jgi:hypothetical protein